MHKKYHSAQTFPSVTRDSLADRLPQHDVTFIIIARCARPQRGVEVFPHWGRMRPHDVELLRFDDAVR